MQSHSPQPVIDSTALDAIREIVGDDDPTMFTQIIDCYLQESPPLLETMRGAISQGNSEELTRSAHSLKSSSEYLGAMELVRLCQKMEQIGRSNQVHDPEEIATLMAQIEAQYTQVAAALEQECSVK